MLEGCNTSPSHCSFTKKHGNCLFCMGNWYVRQLDGNTIVSFFVDMLANL
jgi:hypothetical protein